MSEAFEKLKERLAKLGSVLVAYSGGVDSTFLAKVAEDVLGGKALAVTACSETYPEWERNEAAELAKRLGFRHMMLETSELGIPGYRENPAERCYFCKTELFVKLRQLADAEGIKYLLDGTNADDLSDFRPGRRAAKEQGVISPLLEVGMGKKEIREQSRLLGLPTSEKPSFACLASRIPFGETITAEKLHQVDEAEKCLRKAGFRQCRVRHHGNVARIEIELADTALLLGEAKAGIIKRFKELGFKHIAFDLEGYRTGSMNP